MSWAELPVTDKTNSTIRDSVFLIMKVLEDNKTVLKHILFNIKKALVETYDDVVLFGNIQSPRRQHEDRCNKWKLNDNI